FIVSSRRRHTRSKRDWSSDVCSSDLLLMAEKKEQNTETKDVELFTSVEQVKNFLLERGKTQGHLSHEEIADKLSSFELDADAMDEFFDELNENDIQLINEKDASD